MPPPCISDTVGLVEKVVAVARRRLCVLIDCDRDRLNMLEIAFTRGPLAQLGERI